MSRKWMIYGANGYTGRLAARFAKEHNLDPILAGRLAEPIRELAGELGFESRVFDLADPAKVAANLEGVSAVLHCAGPFSATSGPMLAGCLRAGTHYLDITGEIMCPGAQAPGEHWTAGCGERARAVQDR